MTVHCFQESLYPHLKLLSQHHRPSPGFDKVNVISFGKCATGSALNKTENWETSSILRVSLAEMRVRTSGPVADCLTPMGLQVEMGKERGSSEMMGQHQKYSFLERQMQL